MRHTVANVLFVVAAIPALPIAGILGAQKLTQLYGVAVQEPNLTLLLRHRVVLFGLLAAFLAYAAFVPSLHRMALGAATVSVGSFLVLAHPSAELNAAVFRVVVADWVAVVLLVIGVAAHVWQSIRAGCGQRPAV